MAGNRLQPSNHVIPSLRPLNKGVLPVFCPCEGPASLKANAPVYVLEYLLGSYCASNDADTIQDGLKTVKRILSDNYVWPDEAEKVKRPFPRRKQKAVRCSNPCP